MINRDGVANLARASHACNSKLLHISTDYVFQGEQQAAYCERDETGPTGVYGASKLAGERAAAAACPQHIILRTAWVFGTHGGNFVKTMIRLAQDRTELNVVGDQFGGPTYAGDIAEALLLIAGKVCDKSFADWGSITLLAPLISIGRDLLTKSCNRRMRAALFPHLTKINPIPSSDYPTPAKRPANSMLNCEKIQEVFGIAPSDWQKALNDIVSYAAKG